MPFLALYTIRSKQKYIFRSNGLIEIVGGSELVQDSFDALYTQAKKVGLILQEVKNGAFNIEAILSAFESGELDGVELSRGGGNDTVLFRGKEEFVAANEAFSRFLLERLPGLIPLCAGVEVAAEDYEADHRLLMAEVERKKDAMEQGRVENAQPFARLDRTTLQAITVELRHGDGDNKNEYRTAEADAKNRKGLLSIKTDKETKFLDNLAKENSQSLLAIVHADVNRLGIKNQKKLAKVRDELRSQSRRDGLSDYNEYVNTMRAFDREIKTVVIDGGKAAVEQRRIELQHERPEESEKLLRVRWLVHEGDDITFICNGKYVLDLTEAYLRAVMVASAGKTESYSACAGICVFHAHYPFYRAYQLAEQACDNAKKLVHAADAEQAWIDFHYLRSGVNGDLEDIRKLHQTQRCIARPWFLCGEHPPAALRIEQLEELGSLLRRAKVARSQIKSFGSELEVSKEAGELVWRRLCSNVKGVDLQKEAESLFDHDVDLLYRALYDLCDFYDLWFQRGGEKHGTA